MSSKAFFTATDGGAFSHLEDYHLGTLTFLLESPRRNPLTHSTVAAVIREHRRRGHRRRYMAFVAKNDAVFSLNSASSGGDDRRAAEPRFLHRHGEHVHSGEQFRALSNPRAAGGHPDEVDLHPCQHGPTAPGTGYRARKLGDRAALLQQRCERGLQSSTVRHRVAVAAQPDLLPADREPCGDRRDGDIDDERQERADGGRGCFIGLPDAWELRYFGTTIYGPTQDNDRDGAKTRRAMMATASSLRCAREASGPFDKPFRQAPADGLSLSNGKAPSLPRGSGPSGCRHTRSTARSISRSKFVRRKNAGLTYTVLFANTPNAASFQPAVNAPSVTPIGANWERVVVDDSVTIGDQAIRIGRVRVTSP